MQKPIYIIGVGAIGMTLAVLLKQAGKEVILIRGRQARRSETDGVKIILDCTDGITLEATVPISTLNQFIVLDGVVLLTTKA
ncbi:ketopantoate reductase family protein [Spirosoma profusum]|uniref:ketopantoate reductase family protein n=1 Tax=Spirosoma profusum TaxID=2771354 RepID=UPI001CC2671B|nr:2-dehydropantoate 2-reductase N-terminal domain-containing protein [Spirosoma profusum]